MTTGEKIKLAIIESGKGQNEIAKILRVSEGAISQWISDTVEPRMPKLQKLALYLGKCTTDLLGDEYLDDSFTLTPTTLTSSGHSQANDELRDTMQYILDNIHDEAQLKQIKMFLETYKK